MKRGFLLIIALLLLSNCTLATENSQTSENPIVKIESGYYCTNQDHRSLSEIEKLDYSQFTGTVSFGYTEDICYFKVQMVDPLFNTSYILDTQNAHYNFIRLIHVQNGQTIRDYETGDLNPFDQRDIATRTFAFELPLEQSTSSTAYFQIKTNSSLTFAPAVYLPEAFLEKDYREAIFLSLFAGSILIMVLYNIVLYIILRDRTYLYYALSVLSNMILQIELIGTAFQTLWPNQPEFHQISMSLQVALSAFFGLLFARGFLRTKARMPRMNRFLLYTAGISGIMLLIYPLITIATGSRIANLHAQSFVLIMMIAGIAGVIYRVREARFFLIAWFFLIAGILLFSLADIGLIPSNPFTRFSNLLGSVLEAVLLSIALADRIQTMRKEKEVAQAESLEAQRILNDELESRIAERTTELKGALDHIQKDLGLARKIQLNLLPDLTHESFHEYTEVYYAPADQVGGDIYDIIRKDKDTLRLMVADATGHGVQGALMSMALRSEYESLKTYIDDPGMLLERLNKRIARKFNQLTAIYPVIVCDLNLITGHFEYASAGHPPVILLQSDQIQLLDRTGPITGFREDIDYTTESLQLQEEDHILVFSDGIFEETNAEGNDFSLERMEEIAGLWYRNQNGSLIERLMIELTNFTKRETLTDDCTIVHIRVPPLQNSVNRT